MNSKTPESTDSLFELALVLAALVGAGYASFFYTGPVWTFIVFFQFAAGVLLLVLTSDAVAHNEGARDCAPKDRDGAHALAQATALGVLAQAGMMTMSVCLATLAPEVRTLPATLAYGILAALAPAACVAVRLLGHCGYYAGREYAAGIVKGADAEAGVPLLGKADTWRAPNVLAAAALVALGYATLFVPTQMFWATLLLVALWLTPLVSGVLRCDVRAADVCGPGGPYGPFAPFWKALSLALLLQAGMAGLAFGLHATGRLAPAGERGPALMCYSMLGVLLPLGGFVAARVHQAMFLAGVASATSS